MMNKALIFSSVITSLMGCKTLQKGGSTIGDGEYSTLSGVQDPKSDLVMTTWFRASEVSLLSRLKFPINANQAAMGGGKGDNIDVDVRFLPSFVNNPSSAQINLALAVSAVGTGTGGSHGVTVTGGVTGHATVVKTLSLGIDGVKSSPAALSSNVDPRRPTIMTSGMLRRLKTRIANNKYWEQIGAHVYEMQSELAKVPGKMDSLIDPQLAVINRQWQQTFYEPFLAKDTSGSKTKLFTTDDALHFAVFQPQSKLRVPVKAITSDPWDDSAAVLLMHQSQIEHQLNTLLAGKTVSVKDLKASLCKFDIGVSLCNKDADSSNTNQTLKFANEKAFIVNFIGKGEGQAKLPTIELIMNAAFDPQPQTFLTTTIRYEVDLANRTATRATLSVDPQSKDSSGQTPNAPTQSQRITIGSLASAAWRTATTTVEYSIAMIAEGVIAKSLPEKIYIPPVGAALIGELSPREWKIEDQWLRVTWVLTPWQDISCKSVNTKTVYNGFVCNEKSNNVDACWEHRGKDFYGNTNGWIKCGESWKAKACSEVTSDNVYYGKKCRFADKDRDSCWYYVGAKEPGNQNCWKPCIIPKI